jgi:hypothetical protein
MLLTNMPSVSFLWSDTASHTSCRAPPHHTAALSLAAAPARHVARRLLRCRPPCAASPVAPHTASDAPPLPASGLRLTAFCLSHPMPSASSSTALPHTATPTRRAAHCLLCRHRSCMLCSSPPPPVPSSVPLLQHTVLHATSSVTVTPTHRATDHPRAHGLRCSSTAYERPPPGLLTRPLYRRPRRTLVYVFEFL